MPKAVLVGGDPKLEQVQSGFEAAGWEVAVVKQVEVALALMERRQIDVVVIKACGVALQTNAGRKMIETLRQNGYSGPVAAIACNNACKLHLEQAGANHVLLAGLDLTDKAQIVAESLAAA